jgi:hypothetical protein
MNFMQNRDVAPAPHAALPNDHKNPSKIACTNYSPKCCSECQHKFETSQPCTSYSSADQANVDWLYEQIKVNGKLAADAAELFENNGHGSRDKCARFCNSWLQTLMFSDRSSADRFKDLYLRDMLQAQGWIKYLDWCINSQAPRSMFEAGWKTISDLFDDGNRKAGGFAKIILHLIAEDGIVGKTVEEWEEKQLEWDDRLFELQDELLVLWKGKEALHGEQRDEDDDLEAGSDTMSISTEGSWSDDEDFYHGPQRRLAARMQGKSHAVPKVHTPYPRWIETYTHVPVRDADFDDEDDDSDYDSDNESEDESDDESDDGEGGVELDTPYYPASESLKTPVGPRPHGCPRNRFDLAVDMMPIWAYHEGLINGGSLYDAIVERGDHYSPSPRASLTPSPRSSPSYSPIIARPPLRCRLTKMPRASSGRIDRARRLLNADPPAFSPRQLQSPRLAILRKRDADEFEEDMARQMEEAQSYMAWIWNSVKKTKMF